MDIGVLNEIANSPFAYLILFMLLLAYVIRSTDLRERKSEERESKMREQMDKTIPILSQILIRLDVIEEKIEDNK